MRYRKKLILILSLFFTLIINTLSEPSLMPYPYDIKFGKEKFILNNKLKIKFENLKSEKIKQYCKRTLHRISYRTGIVYNYDSIFITESSNNIIKINYNTIDSIQLFMNEEYNLKINKNLIELKAKSDIGIIRGLETLLQLLSSDTAGYYFPEVTINDKPRFAWRGLLIDVCRHFIPMDVILRNIDAMAAVKLNVLHLHLTEDQGFRIESKTFPKLHQLGSDGNYFTQEEMKKIIQYAADRGIRIIPEFDMPGHVTSWLVGYPEIASLPGPYSIERLYGPQDPSFNPTSEKTYDFLDKFFKEMANLFPDNYMHIGGDENNGKHWDKNPEIQKFMKIHNIKNHHELQKYFNNRILKILTKYNKKMVGWDEIYQPGLPKDIVIQSWRGKKTLMETAKNGYYSILSNGYYIDLVQPASFHYLNDPLPDDFKLTEEEKKYILGGEATMWSELVTVENIDSRIWPRTAAIAERLWSPKNIKNIDYMYTRLQKISLELEELGLSHIKNYDFMLRRLCNFNSNIQPLKTLVDILEPIKIYTRHEIHGVYHSYEPLCRVVDASKPDSYTAYQFNKLVNEYLSNKNSLIKTQIINSLRKWYNNHEELIPIIKSSPILKEIIPVSKYVKNLSNIGLQAIDYIQNNKKPSNKWFDESYKIIEEAKNYKKAEVEIMIINGIENMIKYLQQ